MSTSSVGSPGRYQRSAGGLVAALVVTVAAVGGLLWFLGLFRPDVEIEREPIDYLTEIDALQGAGLEPVYPHSLPDGWIATEIGATQGLELQMLTDDDAEFVGLHQEKTSAADLLHRYVDEDTTPTDIYEPRGSVANAWQGYEDEGGDTAYAAEVGDQTVLVWGSASPEELQDLIGRLTTEPVD